MPIEEKWTVYVDFIHFYEFDQKLSNTLVQHYFKYELAIKKSIYELVLEYNHPNKHTVYEYFVSFYNTLEVLKSF